MRVLMIDDHMMFLQGLKALLGLLAPDWHLDSADTAVAGLRMAAEISYGLALLDWHLADGDGARTIERLRDVGCASRIVAATAAQQGLQLTVQAQAHAEVWLDTDSRHLHRVLANLVANALKFTSRGSVTLALELSGRPGETVNIAVVDTGPGIPESEHERIFEDFYQIGNVSRDRSRGLGLGLSIVRRTAELLGVGVGLASTVGEGTRFDLEVPTREKPAGSVSDPVGSPEIGAEGPPRLDMRVLAVDDEVDILESLAVMLPELGCEVRCATNLAQALGLIDAGFQPSLLLLDHRLRDETSAEIISRLQERLGVLPTIIVTGDTAPRDLQRMQLENVEVLHKPIDGWQLAQALRRVTDGVVHGQTGADSDKDRLVGLQ